MSLIIVPRNILHMEIDTFLQGFFFYYIKTIVWK